MVRARRGSWVKVPKYGVNWLFEVRPTVRNLIQYGDQSFWSRLDAEHSGHASAKRFGNGCLVVVKQEQEDLGLRSGAKQPDDNVD